MQDTEGPFNVGANGALQKTKHKLHGVIMALGFCQKSHIPLIHQFGCAPAYLLSPHMARRWI